MSGPDCLRDMISAGYKRRGDGTCKACGAAIAWFKTTNGKMLPVNLPIESETVEVIPHFATCPKADEFRGTGRAAENLEGQATQRDRMEMLERQEALRKLHVATGALVVIGLYPEGDLSTWTPGLDPEDTRNGLIAAANRVRQGLRDTLDAGGR